MLNQYLAHMLKNFLFALLLVVSFSGCRFVSEKSNDPLHEQKGEESEKAMQEMVETDQAFSAASATKGMKKAFLEYVADDAVLLRPGYLPIVEGDVIQFLNAQEDTSFKMTWEPKGADVAASNDMGFTYGVYVVTTKDTTINGTYLSIWRRQKDGQWKFILDTGNQGASQSVRNENKKNQDQQE